MSEKHSPLPWAVDPDHRPGYEWNYHVVSAENPDNRICFMTSDGPSEANAELIVCAVNERDGLLAEIERLREQLASARKALELTEKAENIHANCDECGGEGQAEECEFCFPSADDARIARRAALTDETNKPDAWDAARGCAPDITGDLSSEDFVRKTRDEEWR